MSAGSARAGSDLLGDSGRSGNGHRGVNNPLEPLYIASGQRQTPLRAASRGQHLNRPPPACSPRPLLSSHLRCMSNVSNGTPCASDSASGAALLVLEAIATNSSAAAGSLLEVFAAGSWPISKAALLFAAVKLGRSTIAEQLLAAGAPASFVVAELPAADHVSCKGNCVLPQRLLLVQGRRDNGIAGACRLLVSCNHAGSAGTQQPDVRHSGGCRF